MSRGADVWKLRRDRALVEVNHLERLLNVERPQLAGGVDAVPIEQTEGRVARLLDFRDHQSRAQGVDGPGRDEHTVARLRFEGVQTLFHAASGNGRRQPGPSDAWLQSCVDLTPRIGVQYDPRFGLAQIRRLEPRRLLIIRMDLDLQRAVAIEELQQQRKPRAASAGA